MSRTSLVALLRRLGTGRYAGITGSGNASTASIAVTAKNAAGNCIHLNDPATYQAITTANGRVTR